MSDPSSTLGLVQWRQLFEQLPVHWSEAVIEHSADLLRLGWPVNQPTQVVEARLVVAHGQAWMLLTAPLCPADGASARRAIELGARLLIGGVILQERQLCIRAVLAQPLPSIEQLAQIIAVVRDNAIVLRDQMLQAPEAAEDARADAP